MGVHIIFITQSPLALNSYINSLVNEHYHVHRPANNNSFSIVKLFRGHEKNPIKVNTNVAEDTFQFKHSAEIFDLYKSADLHIQKFRMPNRLKRFLIVLILIILLLVWYSSTHVGFLELLKSNNNKTVNNNIVPATSLPMSLPIISTKAQDNHDNLVDYNPSMPFESPAIKYEVKQKPVFSGCAKMGEKIKCYNQKGNIILVDKITANRVIEGDMPFPYFVDEQENRLILQSQADRMQPVNNNDLKNHVDDKINYVDLKFTHDKLSLE
jgi:hypothetical protein